MRITHRGPIVDLGAALDNSMSQLRNSDIEGGMLTLVEGLRTARFVTGPGWPYWVSRHAQTPPVHDWALRYPLTRHSADCPRGYPGDAELIDHICGTLTTPPAIEDETTRRLYDRTRASPASRVVRHLRQSLARLIDDVALQ